MGPKVTYDWTIQRSNDLLKCYELVKQLKNGKTVVKNLHDEFLKLHPECKLSSSTLFRNVRDLLKGKVLPQINVQASKIFWTPEVDELLKKCAVKAKAENKKLQEMGAFAGKARRNTDFGHILTREFNVFYPQLSLAAITNRFRLLKKAGFVFIEEEQVTQRTTQNVQSLPMVMLMWEYGHVFNKEPLFNACCYKCGTLLTRSRKHAIKTDLFNGSPLLHEYYLQDHVSVPLKKGNSQLYYRCTKCVNKRLLQQYPLAPDNVYNLPIPEPLSKLNNVEKRQVALVGLFSVTAKYRNPGFGIFEHKQGEVNALHLTDERYFEMYSMIVDRKEEGSKLMSNHSIVSAIKWLRVHNHLYKTFKANYETLLRYVEPKEGQPQMLPIYGGLDFNPSKKGQTKVSILDDENRGLLIPAYDLAADGADIRQVVTGVHHISNMTDAHKAIKDFTRVRYSDPHLEAKIFPVLFPYGTGGWMRDNFNNYVVPRGTYLKWRVIMIDPRFRRDHNYIFYMLDVTLKERIQTYNNFKVNVANLVEPLTKENVLPQLEGYNPYDRYGKSVPTTIPNSRNFWASKTQDILAISAKLGQPKLFVTLTQNDNWPELQAVITNGPGGLYKGSSEKEEEHVFNKGAPAVNYPVETVIAFFQRLQMFMDRVIKNDKGPFGHVVDHWLRIEYQKRGGLHAHMVLWIEEGTCPEGVISAEMPRADNKNNQIWRDTVSAFQIHRCRPNRCFRGPAGKTLKKCKYGFPFEKNNEMKLDDTGIRYYYVRREFEDTNVASYNLPVLMLWNGHVNVQEVTNNGWEMYLAKYIAKSEVSIPVRISIQKETNEDGSEKRRTSDVETYMKTRLVSSLEGSAIVLQKGHVKSSRDVVFLPVDIEPENRFMKRKKDLFKMHGKSTDIYYDTKLEKYLKRPDTLKNLTYPQFYEQYYYKAKNKPNTEDTDDDEDDDEEDVPLSKRAKTEDLLDKDNRVLKKRVGKEAVTRFKTYSPYGEDLELYCLVKLLKNIPVDSVSIHGLKGDSGSYLQACLDRGLIEQEDEAMHFLDSSSKRGLSMERLTEIAKRLIEGGWLQQQDIKALLKTVAPYHMEVEAAIQQQIADEEDDGNGLVFKRYLPVQEYIDKFSDTQQRAYNYITTKWKKGKQVRAFVTGGGGVGKTFLLDSLVAYCKENGKPIQKCGTTGCASHIIGGMTLHSFLKLDGELKCHIEKGTNEAFLINKLQVLFIDEVSMLEDIVLERINELLKLFTSGPLNKKVFGGKSIIMFGDPAQLPPVKKHIWVPRLFGIFDTLVLRDVMRQKDDQEFVDLLNRVRLQKPTMQDLKTLYGRVKKPEFLLAPEMKDVLRLYPMRKQKVEYNESQLQLLEGDEKIFSALDVDDRDKPVPESTKDFIDNYCIKQNLPPAILKVKVGARVMLTRNRDITHGWVNGRLAKVVSFTDDYVVIESLANPACKLVTYRIKVPIKQKKATTFYYRKQFPLELAYGATIHKAQGQTLDQVIISTTGMFNSGHLYTAISRVKTLEGLYLTEFRSDSIYLAEPLQRLIEWMDDVDVLRGFSGKKPSMPTIPYNLSKRRSKKRKRPVSPSTSSSSEDDKIPPTLEGDTSSDVESVEGDVPNVFPVQKPPRSEDDKIPPTLEGDTSSDVESVEGDVPNVFPVPKPPQHSNEEDCILDEIRVISPVQENFRELMRVIFQRHQHFIDDLIVQVQTSNGIVDEDDNGLLVDVERCKQFYVGMIDHYYVMQTLGDNSCLFNSFGLSLFGHEQRATKFRVLCCYIFYREWALFNDHEMGIVMDYPSVQQLIHDTTLLEGQVSWGNQPHMQAMAIASKREVWIYKQLVENDPNASLSIQELLQANASNHLRTTHYRYAPSVNDPNKRPIMVLHTGTGPTQHFSAILPKQVNAPLLQPSTLVQSRLQ